MNNLDLVTEQNTVKDEELWHREGVGENEEEEETEEEEKEKEEKIRGGKGAEPGQPHELEDHPGRVQLAREFCHGLSYLKYKIIVQIRAEAPPLYTTTSPTTSPTV